MSKYGSNDYMSPTKGLFGEQENEVAGKGVAKAPKALSKTEAVKVAVGKTHGNGQCFNSHPRLSIGGGTFIGGNAGVVPKDADVSVALEIMGPDASRPWHSQVRFDFKIQDRHAPHSVSETKELVNYLCNQLQAGKVVHVGCVGGHGRTGLVLSAVVAQLKLSDDPIAWVRENYCKKAVESVEQVAFLVKNFGCKAAQVTKSSYYAQPTAGKSYYGDSFNVSDLKQVSTQDYRPVVSSKSIWG